jgi:hypothetical protein
LTDTRQHVAHQAAKPIVTLPANELRNPPPPESLPRICRQQTITVHPSDLGDLAKLHQEMHYLTEPWNGAHKAIRAQTEGINGRLKSHFVDLADPKNRLAHGQAAQTILTALMVMVANLHISAAWEQTRQPAEAIPDTTTRRAPTHRADNHTHRPTPRDPGHPPPAAGLPCPRGARSTSAASPRPPNTPPTGPPSDHSTLLTTRSRPISRPNGISSNVLRPSQERPSGGAEGI